MSDFWSMPIGSRRDPTMQGELGPVYRDAAGNAFQVMPQNRLAAMNDRPQAGNALLDVLMPMGNWQNALAAAWEGMTAPRRAMQGEPVTYGETFGTALDAMGGGAFSTAPKGALRSGPIRAYHGSPHDFDKFSMEKIGTGEGAQAYGHGLYFAEAEDVARNYRDALAPGMKDGALRAIGVSDADLRSMRQFTQSAVDPDVAIRDWLHWTGKKETPEIRQAFMQEWNSRNPGHMYEVNINADPDDFLDWDAPLSEQPASVRNALGYSDDVGDWAEEMTPRGPVRIRRSGDGQVAEIRDMGGWYDVKVKPPNGNAYDKSASTIQEAEEFADRYQTAGGRNAGNWVGGNEDKLREAGIPGIKYRDQGSRGVDGAKATRNYVVFDDSMIEIIRKYGIAAAAPMLGLTVEELRSQMEAQGI